MMLWMMNKVVVVIIIKLIMLLVMVLKCFTDTHVCFHNYEMLAVGTRSNVNNRGTISGNNNQDVLLSVDRVP